MPRPSLIPPLPLPMSTSPDLGLAAAPEELWKNRRCGLEGWGIRKGACDSLLSAACITTCCSLQWMPSSSPTPKPPLRDKPGATTYHGAVGGVAYSTPIPPLPNKHHLLNPSPPLHSSVISSSNQAALSKKPRKSG